MLKIKDNVDLKELEKFGFTKSCDGSYFLQDDDYWASSCKIVINQIRDIYFCFDDYEGGNSDLLPTILFDLIQAGLVEKVEK